MTPDHINGTFEVVGGLCSWANVHRYMKEREVKGVYWPTTFFYISWGLWNLFYYPSLNQPWSFWGGCFLTAGSIAWLCLVIKDKIKKINI
jgi:hypothetical protein